MSQRKRELEMDETQSWMVSHSVSSSVPKSPLPYPPLRVGVTVLAHEKPKAITVTALEAYDLYLGVGGGGAL